MFEPFVVRHWRLINLEISASSYIKKNLVSRIIPDKALRDQTFDIAKDPSVDEF